MVCSFGVFVSDFPESENRDIRFFDEISDYVGSLGDVFGSVWVPDHVAPYLDKPMDEDLVEAFTTISYLSALHWEKVFGTMVACNNFRNPALLAKMTANIGALTGGRFILGIGGGWHEPEYEMYGYDFATNYRRARQLNEALQIITGMLREDSVTFEGKYYRVKEARCNPKPSPPPKVLVGCYGEKYSLGIVARYADLWNLGHSDAETLRHKLDVLSGFCDRNDRDLGEIEVSLFNQVALAETEEESERLHQASVWRSMPAITGTPEMVASEMGECLDVGVDLWVVGFLPYHNIESTRLFAEEVVPLL